MMITVFTPTYNRAPLLPRLYESLVKQTASNFEWLIIDDGSDDNTREVVAEFQNRQNAFPIIFIEQKHGGKHRAINKAVQRANGDFFFIVDSDDWLPDGSIEQINQWINEVKDIPYICAVAGTKILSSNELVGTTFEGRPFVDATFLERSKLNITGDKAEVFATKVLRAHPFPEFEGEFFISEGVCWDAICADGYKVRWYNEPIYVCEYLEDGLTKSGANDLIGHVENFKGYSCLIRQCLRLKNSLDSYRDFKAFEETCQAKHLSIHERAEALEWSVPHYAMYRYCAIPVIHNIKRVIYVGKTVTKMIKQSD